MIRTFEQQVGNWAAAVASEAAGLLGTPVVVAGSLIAPEGGAGKSYILVQAAQVEPADEEQHLLLRAESGRYTGIYTVAATLVLQGPDEAATLLAQVEPDGSPVHPVDMLALTVLARLRDRLLTGADGSPSITRGCRGQVTARSGHDEARLQWQAVEAGQPALILTAGGSRRWQIPLRARLEFRLTTGEDEGGVIRQIIPRVATEKD
jgi:hypothetical protein